MKSKSKVWHYYVGDIHGCYQEFLEIEQKIQRHARKHDAIPFIVSVGDLVDRGPDSYGVVKHFLEGQKAKTHQAILGNHEVMFLYSLKALAPHTLDSFELPDWLADAQPSVNESGMWLSQGGFQALLSFKLNPVRPETWQFDPEIMAFLLGLPHYWENTEHIVTHAFTNESALKHLKYAETPALSETLQDEIRQAENISIWQRSKPTAPPDREKIHISGHTPIKRIKRFQKLQCIQIDTGVVFGDRLTAYCQETGKSFSVPAHEKHWHNAWHKMRALLHGAQS